MNKQPVEGDFRIIDGVDKYFYRGEWWPFDVRSDYERGSDDMLEQVIEWLLCASLYDYLYLWDEGAEIKKDELIADLKKEMRPQEDSNDSP